MYHKGAYKEYMYIFSFLKQPGITHGLDHLENNYTIIMQNNKLIRNSQLCNTAICAYFNLVHIKKISSTATTNLV